ncbi:MAG: ABC transporter permease [Bacteroidota bacterium]
MIENYLKIALRTLKRQFTYSMVNITGLALGLASSVIILFYVHGELSYDKHFEDSDSIYRLSTSFLGLGNFASGPEVLVDVLREEVPEVERATRLKQLTEIDLKVGGQTFTETKAYQVDSAYFRMFSYPFLSGNANTAMNNTNAVVISDEVAMRYFGSLDVLGQLVTSVNDEQVYTVTGVIKSEKERSHFDAEIWLPIQDRLEGEQNWYSASFYNYVKVREGTTPAQFKNAIDRMLEAKICPLFCGDQTYAEYKAGDEAYKLFVQPLGDIYLTSKLRFELSPGGNETNVYTFSIIGIFIISLAIVNFVNLSTARSSRRAKEVGVRKALGTAKKGLVTQFLLESIVISLAAMLISVGLVEFFLVLYENFIGVPLIESLFNSAFNWGIVFLLSLFVGVLAGVYPAFYLTAFKPIEVLKQSFFSGGRSGRISLRNFLVVFQFSISICLLICTALVQLQMQYIRTKDLGFQDNNVVIVRNASALGTNRAAFKEEISRLPQVTSSSLNSRLPAGSAVMINTYQTPQMENAATFNTFFGDDQFIPTLGMRIVEGRNFSADIASDTAGVILNESAVRAFMLDEPIGAMVNQNERVVGIVSDFNFESLRNEVAPVVIKYRTSGSRIAFKIDGQNTTTFVAELNKQWQAMSSKPMKYYFLDENFGEFVEKEAILGQTVSIFTVLAVIISCLGLFGLSAFTAEQRTKEIGIRKVLGASIANIVVLLNRGFTKPILVAIVLAIPGAYYLMQQWLSNFAYKINLEIWVFAVSAMAALLLAWLTVGYHSIKAASSNPVEALKDE